MLLSLADSDILAKPIEALGFRRRRADRFTADGVTMTTRDGWLILESTGPGPADAAGRDRLGTPGFWKPVANGRGAQALRCDIPLAALLTRLGEGAEDELDPADSVAAIVGWALETRPDASVPAWQPPPAERLGEILPAPARSLSCGPHLAQVRIVAEPGRLALRAPICRAAALAVPRRQWLGRLRDEARGLRLVRVGLRQDDDGALALEAEVDLSGAPPGVVEAALPVALDALGACFSLLASTASVICAAGCRSGALDTPPDELRATFDTKSSHARSKS